MTSWVGLIALLIGWHANVAASQACEDQYFVANQQLSTASAVPSNTPIQGALCVSSGDFFRATVSNTAPGFVVFTFNTTSYWQPDLSYFVLTFTNANSATAVPLPSIFGDTRYPAFPDNSVNLTLQSVVAHPGGAHEYRVGLSNFWSNSFKYPYNLTIAYSASLPPAFVATAASPKLLAPGVAAFAATSTGTAVFAVDVNANDELVIGYAARANVSVSVKGAGLDHAVGNASSLAGIDISQPTTTSGRVTIEVAGAPSTFNVVSLFAKANRKCDPGADGIVDSDSAAAPRVITLGQSATAAICRYSDIDYFRVNVPRPMALKIQFTPALAGLAFAVSAKALVTNETVFSRSFSTEGTESAEVVSTGALIQVAVNAPSTPTAMAPGGRYTLLVTEDVCPYADTTGYPAFLQRSTAVPVDRQSFSTGFCTNQTLGEHWFVGETYAPGWIFYLGTLSSSTLPAGQSITVSLPDIAGAPSWTVNTTLSLRRQTYVGTTVGKVYVRVQRAVHAGAPPLAYTVDFGFYSCNATALPPTYAVANLELNKPLAVRTCVTPTSGATVTAPTKMLFTPSAPGLFLLNATSQRPAQSAQSAQLQANTTYLTLTDQYVAAGSRLNAYGFVSIAAPTNFSFTSSISSLGEVSLEINSVACDETSTLFAPEIVSGTSWLVSLTVAAATAKRAQLQALEQRGGFVRGIFCAPDVHYYALGVRNGSFLVQLSSVRSLSSGSSNTLGYVYLVSGTGTMLGTRSSLYTSSASFTLTQTAAQSDNILLAFESTAPYAYVAGIVVSGCSAADEANNRVLTLDQRVTANWCPASDQDTFTLLLATGGLYNVTIDLPLPLAGTIYVSSQLYADSTRTTLLSSTSCSSRNNGLATRSCQFALAAGNVTFTTYTSSQFVVYGYGIKVTRVAACAVDALPPATTFAAALAAAAVAPDVERSATFCPSAPDAHFFALPPLTAAQATMTFTFDSNSASPPSTTDPLWRLDAALLDAQQRVVARIGSEPSPISTLPPIALPATARVLRVQRVNHTQPTTPPQTYSFEYSLYECVTDADDGTADSLQFPRLLPLGDTNRLFSICPPGDIDYFRFAVSAGAYVLRVGDKVPLSEPSRFSVRVFDGNAELLTEQRPNSYGIEKAFLALGGDVVVSVQSSRQADYDITLVRSTAQCLSASAPEEASSLAMPLDIGSVSPYQTVARTLTFCSTRGPSTHYMSVRRFFSDLAFRVVTNETEGTLTLSCTLPNGTTITAPANAPVQTASDAFSGVSSGQPTVFQVTRTNPVTAVQVYRVVLSSYECAIDALDGPSYATLLVPGVLSNLTVCRSTTERFRFELTDFEQVTIRTTPATLSISVSFRDKDTSSKVIGTGTGSVSVDNAPIGTYTVDVTDPSYAKTLVYSIEATVAKPRAPSPTPTRRLIVSQAPTPLPTGPTPPTTPPPPGQTPATTAAPQCGNRAREGDEVCDGESCCAADCRSFKPATAECRAAQASADCDLPELCDGVSATCPTTERVRDATHVCRASLGVCSDVTKCDGASTLCPAIKLLAAGSPCTDEDAKCTTDDKCDANGQCVGRFTCDCRSAPDPAKACDDKNDCTVDSCDSAGACVNTRAAVATKCTPPPAVLMAAMVCDATPTFTCTADAVCANAVDAVAGNSTAAGTCPGEPVCSGRGVCCAGRCRCPAAFTGLDCGKEVAGPDIKPSARPVVVTFADQKESLTGVGSETARVRLADGSALVLRAGGGTVTMGDEAIGVTGTAGDADQIEFPETLTVSLDGRAFVLRGIIFSDFSAERNDVATVSLAGDAARRRAATLEPFNITVADWRAPEDLPPVTSFTIAPAMGGDGFGLLSLDLLDVSNGSAVGTTTAPSDVSAAPRGVEDGGLDADTLMYIYIGVGVGVGLICCVLLVLLVVCLVKRRNSDAAEAHSQHVPLAQYHSEGQVTDLPQAPVAFQSTQTVGVYASVRDVQSEQHPSQYCTVPNSESHDSYGTLSVSPAPVGASASQYLSPGEAGRYLGPDLPAMQHQASQYLPLTTSARESMSSQEYVRPPAVGTYSQL